MARPVRNNEVAGKLKTLKEQLAELQRGIENSSPYV